MALTRASAAVVKTEELVNNRNRIINGDMRIDQRNAGAAVTGSGYVSVDRFFIANSNTTSQRITSGSATGFSNYLKLTKNAGSSIDLRQTVELPVVGQAGEFFVGSTWTLSFWAKSISGGETLTFYSYFRQGVATGTATSVAAPATPTITLSTGWTFYKTTFTIDVSPSGSDLCVAFRLDTTASELHITGVQLEAGSVATPFERRPYGTELALCQRYYYKMQATGNNGFFASAYNILTTRAAGITQLPISMRTAPTALEQNGTAGDYRIYANDTNINCSAVPVFSGAEVFSARTEFVVASGLTVGQGSQLRSTNASAYLAWSAEL
jgi:hypothetical protein